MNKANLKSYAPKARLDFIKAVTERANVLGISATGTVPAQLRGDVALIDGREWPAKVAGQRDELIARIRRHGFAQTMDEVAYTWFNRFAALRYMEIHDYLGHGWRVLSSRDGGLPEILRHASEMTLPGLSADHAREMQLAGNQDNELYKLLLVAQCNELSRVMPFLFERIDDETELLLPENLLRTDSIVAKLVESVPEEDWQEIEVIGWLYQFYISEKKEQVIGKVVKSEDIPAATQLFTPNWIVQYLVQNSVGRLWLMANPSSTLASQWPYYIQPAEQTPEVQAQLDALIQTRVREDGETLNPETITVLDPACGSGHILVVAYDVLKAIYLERGYQPRTIPRLILEKNLYGVDIDDRAGQLAAFALLMKARSDDRKLFNDPPKLNVLSLQDSNGMDAGELAIQLGPFGLQVAPLKALLDTFENAKIFGSLIQISPELNLQLAGMATGLQVALREGDLYATQAAKEVMPLIWSALVLGMQFDSVVANPPYMGYKAMPSSLKSLIPEDLSDYKADLFSVFVARLFRFGRPVGFCSCMTPFTWLYLQSFAKLRGIILDGRTLTSLIEPEYHAFFDSAFVPICAFSTLGTHVPGFYSDFINLSRFTDPSVQSERTLEAIADESCAWRFRRCPDDFKLIDDATIAYWCAESLLQKFKSEKPFSERYIAVKGLDTCDNDRFMRRWFEPSYGRIGRGISTNVSWADTKAKWFPYCKGGAFRRWAGNVEHVVEWEDDGHILRNLRSEDGRIKSRPQSTQNYFRSGITFGSITSSDFSCRYMEGAIFGGGGNAVFGEDTLLGLAFLNSKLVNILSRILNPTLNVLVGDILRMPFVHSHHRFDHVRSNTKRLIEISSFDWNSQETSLGFNRLDLIDQSAEGLKAAVAAVGDQRAEQRRKMKALEEENNSIFIDAYGLDGEISPEVEEDAISLFLRNSTDDCLRLISYAIGCMMGRYSLDEPGLIYAHAGNVDFDPTRYKEKFLADADGIVPLTYERWFEDDAASRVREFLCAAWGANTLNENLAWLAESLGTKGTETPDEAVRRYLADKFFKDHLQTYKKRPIYWLFSSGKQGAFQALIYLHRYNEGTLARMRAEYVVPLIAKVASRLNMLEKDVAAASSAAARTKLQKQIESLRKKQTELLAYDEKLRHYADMRITLDLDDGVKVNYAKFGDLVAESKAITGGSDE